MNRGIGNLFNSGRGMQQMLETVGIREKNNNTTRNIMLSVVGLGVGAAAYTMMRDRNNNANNIDMQQMIAPVQNAIENVADDVTNENQQ
ncbi:DUF3918 family protein [Desertibacillus haloalkaliphilus]|uniref:DUF3918 family protein n=1 Tax=Desertibacillus haloalkaliphilus TaxID=1328930 RepID=UPI001C2749A5|nr:DUF3918 family protein [Desertibacillus haloalkaliphilus]MBU8907409.1 DUF3918 family protein [Desertibacillus haloalkaliphilus]